MVRKEVRVCSPAIRFIGFLLGTLSEFRVPLRSGGPIRPFFRADSRCYSPGASGAGSKTRSTSEVGGNRRRGEHGCLPFPVGRRGLRLLLTGRLISRPLWLIPEPKIAWFPFLFYLCFASLFFQKSVYAPLGLKKNSYKH